MGARQHRVVQRRQEQRDQYSTLASNMLVQRTTVLQPNFNLERLKILNFYLFTKMKKDMKEFGVAGGNLK